MFVIGMLVAALALQPSSYRSGEAVRIDDRLDALIVRTGTSSPLVRTVDRFLPDLSSNYTIDMRQSSMNAWAAARAELGLPNEQGLLLEVNDQSRAWSTGFRTGDLVTEIVLRASVSPRDDGRAATVKGCVARSTMSVMDRWAELADCAATVVVRRDGRTLGIDVRPPGIAGSEPHLIAGIQEPVIPSVLADINGNSAGLALALLYLDQMTPGSLIGDDLVAATGAINPSTLGVTGIGLVTVKATGAARAGVTLMLAPEGQHLDPTPRPGMTVVGVSSLREAVAVLCERGASSPLCRL